MSDNKIEIPRGTSLDLIVTPIDMNTGEEYILTEGEKVIFTVKARPQRNAKIYLQKVLTLLNYDTDNHLLLSLTPDDTKNLQEYSYVYDCLLQTVNDDVYQFIEVDAFIVEETVGEIIQQAEQNGGEN